MKNLTDFRETVETGVDPRLSRCNYLAEVIDNSLVHHLREQK